MKILSVSHSYPPHVGGLEAVAQAQAKSLVKHGHQVSVVTFACAGAPKGTTIVDGIPVHRVFGVQYLDTHFGIPFAFGGVGMIKTLFREVRATDVVHLHDVFYLTSWVTYLACLLFRKPLVLTQHVAMVHHTSTVVMLIQKLVYGFWGTLIFRASEAIIVYNKNVRTFLESRGVPPHTILELRNGIDMTVFHPGEPGERERVRTEFGLPLNRPLVLFVGRFVPKKGYDQVYGARDPAYDLVFVGSGAFPDAWTNDPTVHALGALDTKALSRLYRAVDLFVFPAQGEIFTLVMQEALASGVPVLTTNDPVYVESGIDTTLVALVEPTASSLKKEITRILADDELRTRMARYSVELAQKWFDWEKNIAPILELYARIAWTRLKPVVTTSWDDGHILDMKLAELLTRYGIRGTFYIAPRTIEFGEKDRLTDDAIRRLSTTHEIGAHTMSHRWLTTLTDEDAYREIVDSREYLEKVIKAPVTSFCYPAGKHTRAHARMAERAGYTLSRTVRRFSFRIQNPHELDTSVHTYNHWLDILHLALFVRGNPFTFFTLYRHWDLQAMAMFDRVCARGGIFHLWGHSWEVEAHHDWERLERVLAYIHGKSGVRYVTNGELRI
jgi:D-inositol-3-phosphate glycosyltransferase